MIPAAVHTLSRQRRTTAHDEASGRSRHPKRLLPRERDDGQGESVTADVRALHAAVDDETQFAAVRVRPQLKQVATRSPFRIRQSSRTI
jgi:hypothetical protein